MNYIRFQQLFTTSLIISLGLIAGCSGSASNEQNAGSGDSTTMETDIKPTEVSETFAPSVAEKLQFQWSFDFIKNEAGEDVKPVTPEDFMIINEDKTFNYQLFEAGIEASGTWKLSDDEQAIIYTYTPKTGQSDTIIRTYVISKLDENALYFQEKGITYAFKK